MPALEGDHRRRPRPRASLRLVRGVRAQSEAAPLAIQILTMLTVPPALAWVDVFAQLRLLALQGFPPR